MSFQIKGLGKIESRLNKIAENITRPRPMLEKSGSRMADSIRQNFKEQGRPEKWSPLNPATLKARRRRAGKIATISGHKRRGRRKILIDTGWLISSIRHVVFSNEGVAAGTSVRYAKRHQFGYPGGSSRGHSKTPSRPFVIFQPMDVRDIGEIFSKHVKRR